MSEERVIGVFEPREDRYSCLDLGFRNVTQNAESSLFECSLDNLLITEHHLVGDVRPFFVLAAVQNPRSTVVVDLYVPV